ncbi:MAG TPA: hypothetical protein VHI13_12055 [Candidatus Kapabacteria bacterium]|nr:hypothetical protein [Candidatus Kapabacteria bacterium]
MSTPKEEINELLQVARGMSESMLQEAEGFQPFGLMITSSGELKVVAPNEGLRDTAASTLVSMLENDFREEGTRGLSRASAIVYEIRGRFDEEGAESDAIAVAADHRDTYSVIVYFPYTRSGEGIAFGTAVVFKGKDAIFAR